MHAVAVSLTIHERDAAVSELHERVVPAERRAPGFVASYWFALPNDQGRGVIVFDSEDAAEAVAGQVGASRKRQAVTIDSVEVGEVVAHA